MPSALSDVIETGVNIRNLDYHPDLEKAFTSLRVHFLQSVVPGDWLATIGEKLLEVILCYHRE